MANLQYIGARYVPIFFDNPDDHSSEWKSSTSYEALTVVTYLDDSYTSRKPVPSSIGNPADNPSYWAKTGNYNAAISAVQADIADLQNDVGYINGALLGQSFANRKFVFQSDSYLTLLNEVITWMGLISAQYITIGSSGGGFTVQGSDGHTFITDLQPETADDDVTDFVCVGGENDAIAGASATDVGNAMNTYFALVKSKYPKARIYFIPCQHLTDTTSHCLHYINDLYTIFRRQCAANGVKFYENAPYIINRLDMVSSDRQHYNVASGIPFATQYIINILSGGDLNVARNEKVTGTVTGINGTAAAWVTTNNAVTIVDLRIGNSSGAFAFDEATSVSDLVNTRKAIANFSMFGGHIVNGFAFREMIPCFIYTKSPNYSKIHTSALVEIRDGGDITITLGTDVQSHGSEVIDYIQFSAGMKITDCTYFLA